MYHWYNLLLIPKQTIRQEELLEIETNISLLLKGQPIGRYINHKFICTKNIASKYTKQRWTKLDKEEKNAQWEILTHLSQQL